MKANFSVSKIDNVKIKLKDYKSKIKDMVDFMLNMDELKKSKVFNIEVTKLSFDLSFCNNETIHRINKY